jgi:hypothetical protein
MAKMASEHALTLRDGVVTESSDEPSGDPAGPFIK